MDSEKVKAALEAIKNGDAAAALEILEAMLVSAAGGGEPSADEPAAEPLAENPEPKPEEEMMGRALMRLTATSTASEALAEVERRLERDAKREQESAEAELSARRELVGELVKLGVEFPATAWAGKPEDRNPVKRLADEPIDDLRKRVALHRKHKPAPIVAPASGERELKALSADEIAACKKRGIDPKDFAARKAAAVRRSA